MASLVALPPTEGEPVKIEPSDLKQVRLTRGE